MFLFFAGFVAIMTLFIFFLLPGKCCALAGLQQHTPRAVCAGATVLAVSAPPPAGLAACRARARACAQ